MPKQLDQLPPDATSLARRIQALETQVRELRGARRMGAASVGTLRVYAEDGTTLLAELGPATGGGGRLWTRGLQDPLNMAAYLSSGELQFRPVEDDRVDIPAGITYASDADQYTDLILTSGSVKASQHRAIVTLESTFAGTAPYVYVQAESGTACNLDVSGELTAANIYTGSVAITPSAANTPTSVTVSGLSVPGSVLRAWTTIVNPAPGSTGSSNGVTGTGYTNLSSTGLTVWATRQNTTAVTVVYGIISTIV
jgi:hypothetical protein